MGIDGGEAATLTTGPAVTGMARLPVTGKGVELPMDDQPDGAAGIADGLRGAIRVRNAANRDRRKDGGRR